MKNQDKNSDNTQDPPRPDWQDEYDEAFPEHIPSQFEIENHRMNLISFYGALLIILTFAGILLYGWLKGI